MCSRDATLMTSQVELEVALEAVIRHMEQADVSGNTPSSAQEPPPTPEQAPPAMTLSDC